LVIESSDLKVDESTLNSNEEDNVESKSINKSSADERNGDPFLKAGSIVIKGIGKVLVCAVGENSTLGIIDKKLDTESDTKL
jgi:magnesium-transporting ATPase (P-type)